MEWRYQYLDRRPELGEARQVYRRCELYAGRRRRLLRLRSDQAQSQYRQQLPRARGLLGRAIRTRYMDRLPMTPQHRSRSDQYRILKDADLRDYLSDLPDVAARLRGQAASWTIDEVGDGNLNLVFIIKGPNGGIAAKQALPY